MNNSITHLKSLRQKIVTSLREDGNYKYDFLHLAGIIGVYEALNKNWEKNLAQQHNITEKCDELVLQKEWIRLRNLMCNDEAFWNLLKVAKLTALVGQDYRNNQKLFTFADKIKLGILLPDMFREKYNHATSLPHIIEYLSHDVQHLFIVRVQFNIAWHPRFGEIRDCLISKSETFADLQYFLSCEIENLPESKGCTAIGLSSHSVHPMKEKTPQLYDEHLKIAETITDGTTLYAIYVYRESNRTDPNNFCPGSPWKPTITGIKTTDEFHTAVKSDAMLIQRS